MLIRGVVTLSSVVALLGVSTPLWAESEPEVTETRSGEELFYTHCGACHGAEGEGDGPLAETLNFAPPDLKRIAVRQGGTFSVDDVRRIVDGRDPLPGHGGPEMPIWGDAFKSREYKYSEAVVEEKIGLIVEYLATIQEPAMKPARKPAKKPAE